MQNPYNPQSNYQPPTVNFGTDLPGGGISQRTAYVMGRTKGWVRFIAVMGFIMGGLMLLVAVGMLVSGRPEFLLLAAVYVVMAIVSVFIPSVKLNSYASRIGALLRSGSASDLEAALNEHRGFWKYFGIMQILVIVLMIVAQIGLASRH